MASVIDLIILGVTLGITYALVSEGLWGSALMFFNVLFAALISFNFYEPLAQLIIDNSEYGQSYADSISMMLLFLVPLLLLRLTTDSLAPMLVRFPSAMHYVGSALFGFGASAITVGMLLLAYQASPVQKKLLGAIDYAHVPFYKLRFDRDFLAFFQYSTGYTFARNGEGPPDKMREFKERPLVFDPEGLWLMLHQQYRPNGEGDIFAEATGAEGAPAATGTPAAGGPGGPGGQGAGMGIPGGTAGAAAGLAPGPN
jgi:uncharacterized membrane protein required for colicin V production